MQTTPTVLREISFQLTQGNPWWGMLLANEYIVESNPLRAPLVLRFKRRIGSAASARGTLGDKLIRGTRGSKLSASQLADIGARKVRQAESLAVIQSGRCATARATETTPKIRAIQRRAVRQRNSRLTRFSSGSLRLKAGNSSSLFEISTGSAKPYARDF